MPNSIIVPVLARKRVNIDGKIAANNEELSKKQALCLTREFHVDALRAQHEYRALADLQSRHASGIAGIKIYSCYGSSPNGVS
jgi:hypothetical protein